jgi:transposase
MRVYLEVEIRRVACTTCGTVKQDTLDGLADNPFYTKRFAFFVGRRCRSMTIKDVAEETRLDWKTIKDLDAQYMRQQLRRAGKSAPKVVGIDESARSARGTPTASWSATWNDDGRSGSVATTARKRAWTSSTNGWVRRRAHESGWR